jgi:NADH-quinone oxidoreductase subunit K
MSITPYLLLAAAMFSLGLYGVLTRRNAIGLLLCVELMVNAVNVNLVAFARHHGHALGQVFVVFAIALTVAEVVVGLALVILLYRTKKGVLVDEANALRH